MAAVRTFTDAQLLERAAMPVLTADGFPQIDQSTGQVITTPAFICGYYLDETRGGSVFEATNGTDGGPMVRFFTLAEIKVAPYRNYEFIFRYVSSEERSTLPIGPTFKLVIPFQVTKEFGIL